MSSSILLVIAVFVASAAEVLAEPVMRAGEWQTVVDNGTPSITCLQADKTLQNGLMAMPQLPNVSCRTNSVSTAGPVTTFSQQCTIRGNAQITLTGTIVTDGKDAFTNTVRSHSDFIGMDTGERLPVPDRTRTMVLRRLGPCKAGEPLVP